MSLAGGYALRLEPDALDADRCDRLAAEAGRAVRGGEQESALRLLEEALALWDGVPLTAVPGSYAERQRHRLVERRLELLETRLEPELELGRHTRVAAELTALADEHPLREGLRALQMLALYRPPPARPWPRCTSASCVAIPSSTPGRAEFSFDLGDDGCRVVHVAAGCSKDLVRDLLRDQHPDLAELPIREVAGGWGNQMWRHWHEDGERYDLEHFQLTPTENTWNVRVRRSTYWALTRSQLTEFVAEAGFTNITWHDPASSRYYQPVLTAQRAPSAR
ncbi:AfsR/SARP family transcriptional regulator [Kitasatospora sp. NPDC001159]